MKNLAQQWVIDSGKTLSGAREEYEGACIDFAGDFLDAIGKGRLAYFNDVGSPLWKYHAAVEIDGLIHDLWFAAVIPTADFLELLGGGWVDYPAEEVEQK